MLRARVRSSKSSPARHAQAASAAAAERAAAPAHAARSMNRRPSALYTCSTSCLRGTRSSAPASRPAMFLAAATVPAALSLIPADAADAAPAAPGVGAPPTRVPTGATPPSSDTSGRRARRKRSRAQAVAAARSGARTRPSTPRMSASRPDTRYQLAPVLLGCVGCAPGAAPGCLKPTPTRAAWSEARGTR